MVGWHHRLNGNEFELKLIQMSLKLRELVMDKEA